MFACGCFVTNWEINRPARCQWIITNQACVCAQLCAREQFSTVCLWVGSVCIANVSLASEKKTKAMEIELRREEVKAQKKVFSSSLEAISWEEQMKIWRRKRFFLLLSYARWMKTSIYSSNRGNTQYKHLVPSLRSDSGKVPREESNTLRARELSYTNYKFI